MFMLGTIDALQKELQLKFKLKTFVKVRVHSIFQFHLGPSNHNKTEQNRTMGESSKLTLIFKVIFLNQKMV